jgi:hypothetical protein
MTMFGLDAPVTASGCSPAWIARVRGPTASISRFRAMPASASPNREAERDGIGAGVKSWRREGGGFHA